MPRGWNDKFAVDIHAVHRDARCGLKAKDGRQHYERAASIHIAVYANIQFVERRPPHYIYIYKSCGITYTLILKDSYAVKVYEINVNHAPAVAWELRPRATDRRHPMRAWPQRYFCKCDARITHRSRAPLHIFLCSCLRWRFSKGFVVNYHGTSYGEYLEINENLLRMCVQFGFRRNCD